MMSPEQKGSVQWLFVHQFVVVSQLPVKAACILHFKCSSKRVTATKPLRLTVEQCMEIILHLFSMFSIFLKACFKHSFFRNRKLIQWFEKTSFLSMKKKIHTAKIFCCRLLRLHWRGDSTSNRRWATTILIPICIINYISSNDIFIMCSINVSKISRRQFHHNAKRNRYDDGIKNQWSVVLLVGPVQVSMKSSTLHLNL